MEQTRQIIFINKGALSPAHYHSWIESQKTAIEKVLLKGEGDKTYYAAQVQVVESVDAAEELVNAGWIYSVVFISVDMAHTAERFQTQHPNIRVFCMYGAVLQGRVTYLDKLWLDEVGIIQMVFTGHRENS